MNQPTIPINRPGQSASYLRTTTAQPTSGDKNDEASQQEMDASFEPDEDLGSANEDDFDVEMKSLRGSDDSWIEISVSSIPKSKDRQGRVPMCRCRAQMVAQASVNATNVDSPSASMSAQRFMSPAPGPFDPPASASFQKHVDAWMEQPSWCRQCKYSSHRHQIDAMRGVETMAQRQAANSIPSYPWETSLFGNHGWTPAAPRSAAAQIRQQHNDVPRGMALHYQPMNPQGLKIQHQGNATWFGARPSHTTTTLPE